MTKGHKIPLEIQHTEKKDSFARYANKKITKLLTVILCKKKE